MSFTLKDIKGAVVDIRGNSDSEVMGYSDEVTAQSSVKLGFNREKLASTMWEATRRNSDYLWFEVKSLKGCICLDKSSNLRCSFCRKEDVYLSADAIIAAEKELIEVEK